MSVAAQLVLQSLRDVRDLDEATRAEMDADRLARVVLRILDAFPTLATRVVPMIDGDEIDFDRFEAVPVTTAAEVAAVPVVPLDPGMGFDPPVEGGDPLRFGVPLAGPVDGALALNDRCALEYALERAGAGPSDTLVELRPAHRLPPEAEARSWSFQYPRATYHVFDEAAPAKAAAAAVEGAGATILAGRPAPVATVLAAGAAVPMRLLFCDPREPGALAEALRLQGEPGVTTVAALAPPLAGLVASGTEPSVFEVETGIAFVEIVDPAGRGLAAGRRGRLVVTPYAQLARPVLRLDTGLEAAWIDGAAGSRFRIVG